MVRSYKELIEYQKPFKLLLAAYELTVTFPLAQIYGLTSQMQICAVSVPSTFAEGHVRGTKE